MLYYTGLLRKCPVSGCDDGPITLALGFGGPRGAQAWFGRLGIGLP
jgi:hypothetical protein